VFAAALTAPRTWSREFFHRFRPRAVHFIIRETRRYFEARRLTADEVLIFDERDQPGS